MWKDCVRLPAATNKKVFHMHLCVQLGVIVITIVYKMSSWMLSQDSSWSPYAEPFCLVLGELPKEENLLKIMLLTHALQQAVWGRDISGRDHLLTQTDFVLRGQNISVEGLTMFLPRGGNVNCLLFLLTVSCIQVETCMSSENTINVSRELSVKALHVLVLCIYVENAVQW